MFHDMSVKEDGPPPCYTTFESIFNFYFFVEEFYKASKSPENSFFFL